MSYRVEIFRGKGQEPWRFRIIGGNGEIVAQSEGYYSHWNAKRAATKLARKLNLDIEETK